MNPFFTCLTLVAIAATTTLNTPDDVRLAGDIIRDATQMEHSPEFTDLYLIETEDHFRQIHVYCNAGGCYKLRGVTASV